MIGADYYPSDTWDIQRHLRGVSEQEFNALYARARRQTAIMALTSGNFEWRNYKGILRKARTMLLGKPSGSREGAGPEPRGLTLPPGAGLPSVPLARVTEASR